MNIKTCYSVALPLAISAQFEEFRFYWLRLAIVRLRHHLIYQYQYSQFCA